MKALVRFNFSGTSEVPTASSLKLERRNKRVFGVFFFFVCVCVCVGVFFFFFQKWTEGRFSLTKEITSSSLNLETLSVFSFFRMSMYFSYGSSNESDLVFYRL